MNKAQMLVDIARPLGDLVEFGEARRDRFRLFRFRIDRGTRERVIAGR